MGGVYSVKDTRDPVQVLTGLLCTVLLRDLLAGTLETACQDKSSALSVPSSDRMHVHVLWSLCRLSTVLWDLAVTKSRFG